MGLAAAGLQRVAFALGSGRRHGRVYMLAFALGAAQSFGNRHFFPATIIRIIMGIMETSVLWL
ncbi:putative membrane protein [Neisseria meningitidis NM151]|nr:putative membrane protein [Neisseria meningitidis NM151]